MPTILFMQLIKQKPIFFLRESVMYPNLLKCAAVIMAITFCAAWTHAESLPVENHSFEIPAIDPVTNPFMAIPVVPFWIELDTDTDPLYGGRNTGVFLNPEPNSIDLDHIVNVDGNQLAFLGSGTGNALLQDLSTPYQAGRCYRMTVDICPSLRHPPADDPNNALTLEFYYINNEPNLVSLATASVSSTALTPNLMKPFSVALPTVEPDDLWVDRPIGIAIRAVGMTAGKYWDLDNVRVTAYPRRPELSGNSTINFEDFALLAADWQRCNADADLTGDGCVTIEDIWILSDYWLEESLTE